MILRLLMGVLRARGAFTQEIDRSVRAGLS